MGPEFGPIKQFRVDLRQVWSSYSVGVEEWIQGMGP